MRDRSLRSVVLLQGRHRRVLQTLRPRANDISAIDHPAKLLGHIIPTRAMARTDVIKAVQGFDVAYRECEDRDFIIRCCAAGYRVEGLTEPLARVRRIGQDGLTSRATGGLYRTDLRMCWKHRAYYLRAYGPRGILSFALEKIYQPSSKTRLVDGAVRRLTRWVKVKYDIRPGYRDPVLVAASQQPGPISQWPPEARNFAGGNCK